MKDEQVTFDGIPIPLTLETLVNATVEARIDEINSYKSGVRSRQYRAFRERILRVDAEKDEELNHLRKYRNMELTRDLEKWSKKHLKKKDELAAKDTRIAELEERREIIDVDKSHLWNINKNLKQRIAELEEELEILRGFDLTLLS